MKQSMKWFIVGILIAIAAITIIAAIVLPILSWAGVIPGILEYGGAY